MCMCQNSQYLLRNISQDLRRRAPRGEVRTDYGAKINKVIGGALQDVQGDGPGGCRLPESVYPLKPKWSQPARRTFHVIVIGLPAFRLPPKGEVIAFCPLVAPAVARASRAANTARTNKSPIPGPIGLQNRKPEA